MRGFCTFEGMPAVDLNDKEVEFLRLIVEDLTYAEIAERMGRSRRTIDGYRDDPFKRLNAKSRTGLIRFSVFNGIGKLPIRSMYQEPGLIKWLSLPDK